MSLQKADAQISNQEALTEQDKQNIRDGIDFDASVSNNTSVLANTAKRSYPLVDEQKLSTIENGAQVNEVEEAPQDGNQYARKDGAWEQVQASGGQQPVTEPPQLVNGVVQVDLSNPQGIYSDATVTTTEQFEVIAGAVTGGVHVFRVNLPTDPDASITGATRYVNSEFIENVDLLLVFERFNFGTRYYFLEI